MNFNGLAKRLVFKDIEIIAGYLGCEVAVVRAVLALESANSGFDAQGRPKMLFEPHVFYRELGPGVKRTRAENEGIAYRAWKLGSYPNDSYPRLYKAMAIDETKALRSASWGMHQGMGFNHEAMGFASVQEYVKAMMYSESAHLYAMGRFVVSKSLQRHLRAKNWSSFAKGYNGANYLKNSYHTKLKEAYDRRPQAERYVPPPASMTDLNMLLGLAVPPVPKPKPEPHPQPPKVERQQTGIQILIALILAAATAAAGWFLMGR
jgi:hypothetical protein